jgi:hypothetical protein
MRTKIIFLAAALLAAAAFLAVADVAGSTKRTLCQSFGGKWASTDSQCVTRLCYRTGTCGHWIIAPSACDRLTSGAPVSEVYFQLGEPNEIKGNQYIWHEWIKSLGAEAVIDHDRLSSLTCGDRRILG